MDEEQIRQALPSLSEEQQSAWMFQFLQQYLNQFAGLGVPTRAIDKGVQHLIRARAESAVPQERLDLGKALVLLAGTLLGYPAGKPSVHDEVNPHIFLKVLEYVCHEWLAQRFDPKALQEILEGFAGELKKPWTKPELN